MEYCDHAVLAQLGVPDMRLPIQYALTYPNRADNAFERLSLTDVGTLTFEKPDTETFKCLPICIKAINEGGLAPTAVNGANEEAVALFLQGKIKFLQIADLVEKALAEVKNKRDYTVEDIFETDKAARKLVRDAEREMWKNADFEAARNLSQKNSTKPNQIHHYATNKSKTYTHQMEEIAKKYGLDLNGKWNKDLLPHQGRHPNEYHEYVLNSMKQFDEVAQGNVDIFLQLYEKMKAYIKANPDMLYKAYWLQ